MLLFTEEELSLVGWRLTVSLVSSSNKATASALDKSNAKNIFKRK